MRITLFGIELILRHIDKDKIEVSWKEYAAMKTEIRVMRLRT